jgi:glyoxylase I family protein
MILEFILHNPEADGVAGDRQAKARAELKRWAAGDHTSNNTFR